MYGKQATNANKFFTFDDKDFFCQPVNSFHRSLGTKIIVNVPPIWDSKNLKIPRT